MQNMGLESGFGDRRSFSEEIAWEQSRERSEGNCQARAGDAAGLGHWGRKAAMFWERGSEGQEEEEGRAGRVAPGLLSWRALRSVRGVGKLWEGLSGGIT